MRDLAQTLYNYLCVVDKPKKADIVIGFGSFDGRVAITCGKYYEDSLASKVLFTGGRGSGTADIVGAEADWYYNLTKEAKIIIDEEDIFCENKSTNTSENVSFSVEMLSSKNPPIRFGVEIKTAAISTTPYRQRRVMLTCQKALTGVSFINIPPKSSYEEDERLFAEKGIDFIKTLKGEIDRIIKYGKAGYIAQTHIENIIYDAYVAIAEKIGESCELR